MRPGTTIVALLIQEQRGGVVWAGDSRLYRLRGGELKSLSRDHSQVQDLVDRGLLRAEDAEDHPLAHVITRAIGFDKPAKLDSRPFNVMPGDRYLLCTDGLNRVVPDADVAFETRELLRAATRGTREAKARGKQAYYRQIDMDLRSAYEFATEVMAETSQTAEGRERIRSFVEKRPAKYGSG